MYRCVSSDHRCVSSDYRCLSSHLVVSLDACLATSTCRQASQDACLATSTCRQNEHEAFMPETTKCLKRQSAHIWPFSCRGIQRPDWQGTSEGRREGEGERGERGKRAKEGGRERTPREREKRKWQDELKEDNSHGGKITDNSPLQLNNNSPLQLNTFVRRIGRSTVYRFTSVRSVSCQILSNLGIYH